LTSRRVRFTATARRHVLREKAWWLEHRIYPEVFVSEFEQAVKLLSVLPGAGRLYERAGIPGLRRVYVPKVACHLYYTFDEVTVVVRAFWAPGASAALAFVRSSVVFPGLSAQRRRLSRGASPILCRAVGCSR
jgi:hypothetical protein